MRGTAPKRRVPRMLQAVDTRRDPGSPEKWMPTHACPEGGKTQRTVSLMLPDVNARHRTHFSMHGDAKASVVERFNRTSKRRMYRQFLTQGTLLVRSSRFRQSTPEHQHGSEERYGTQRSASVATVVQETPLRPKTTASEGRGSGLTE